MRKVLSDVSKEIPQDWFYELQHDEEPEKSELSSIDYDLYQSECYLLGNMMLDLFIGEDGFYYMRMSVNEPIGDYGSHWCDYWYKCEQEHIHDIVEILEDREDVHRKYSHRQANSRTVYNVCCR